MKTKLLIIPIFALALLLSCSRMTVHAEEETTYTVHIYCDYSEFLSSSSKYVSDVYDYTFDYTGGTMYGYVFNESTVNLITEGDGIQYCNSIGGRTLVDKEGISTFVEQSRVSIQRMPLENVVNSDNGAWPNSCSIPYSSTYIYENVMLFSDLESLINYLSNGDKSGWINKPEIDIEKDGVLNPTMEIPVLTVDSIGYEFEFVNGAENVYFEMKGRWYTVDDIELYKENLIWKYRYSTLIKSELTTWVSASEERPSVEAYNFTEIGAESFENLIQSYPIENRTYTGGTNAIGNWLGGYNDALKQLQMLLGEPTSIYNGVEVYVRYFYYDESGNPVYSRWTHYYDNLANPKGSSGSSWDDDENMYTENQSQVGLTDDELKRLEDTDNSRNDADVAPNYTGSNISIDGSMDMKGFTDTVRTLSDSIKDFPTLIAKLFSFLPEWILALIAFAIGCCVLLRFLGR